MTPIDTSEIEFDRAQVFLLYATFAGDVVRTAHAAGVRPVDVLRVADQENWTAKLAPILELSKSQQPGSVERAINRALNFTQTHRLRLFLEKVLSRVCGMSEAELKEYVFLDKPDKNGNSIKSLSTRALADLATAVEKCHAMSYLALNDTAQDRGRRKEQSNAEDTNAGELHVRIAAAMSAVKASSTPRMALLDAQLAVAATLTREAAKDAKPSNPNDRDDPTL
jgi:hypothetical protein